jgi:hypothetical protein
LKLYQGLLATLGKARLGKDLNKEDKEPILQLLFSLGYLTVARKKDGRVLLEVPNGEMRRIFQRILMSGMGLFAVYFLSFLMDRRFLLPKIIIYIYNSDTSTAPLTTDVTYCICC